MLDIRNMIYKTQANVKEYKITNLLQGPRKKVKSVGAHVLKLTPKCLKFAFYCIFTLQFFQICAGPGPHGPHGYEGPAELVLH